MKKIAVKWWGGSQCTILSETDDKIESADLADFLFLFRGTYAAGVHLIQDIRSFGGEPDPRVVAERMLKRIQKLTIHQINDLFREDLGPDQLSIERISHNSPFEIVLGGSMILIVAAIILSGGRIEFSETGFKAILPPIGKGIEELRKALTSKTHAPIGYGVKSRTVRLSKDELGELMLQDPEKKDKGGYQRFLVGLQYRVNRVTRTLTLSEEDMNRILRAGKNRSRGGFQSRIYKIFNRHFDFNEKD